MTLQHLARLFNRCAAYTRDVNALRRGRIVQRVENRIIGRIVMRVLRKVWR